MSHMPSQVATIAHHLQPTSSRQLDQRFREATSESRRGNALRSPHFINPMREHDAHAHVEVPLNMTMKRPSARVIELEPDRSPPERKHRHVVARGRRIHLERGRRIDGVIHAVAVPHDPEIVPVQVPGVHLGVVRLEHGAVLQHKLHDVASGELVDAAR